MNIQQHPAPVSSGGLAPHNPIPSSNQGYTALGIQNSSEQASMQPLSKLLNHAPKQSNELGLVAPPNTMNKKAISPHQEQSNNNNNFIKNPNSLAQSLENSHLTINNPHGSAMPRGQNLMSSSPGGVSHKAVHNSNNMGLSRQEQPHTPTQNLQQSVSPQPHGSVNQQQFNGNLHQFNHNLNTSYNRNPIDGPPGAGGSGMQSQVKMSRVSGKGTAVDRNNALNNQNPNQQQRVRATTNDPRDIQGMGKKLVGLGYGIPGPAGEISPDHVTSEVKEKFQKYLRLIFTDLCAKDNGLNMRTFGLYTFQKYARRLPGYLSKRLYTLMSSDKVDSDQMNTIMQSQNGAGGPQAQKKSGQKNRKILLADRDKFIKILMSLFAGTNMERRQIIFKMLDSQNKGTITKSQVRVSLYHMFQFRDCLAGFGVQQTTQTPYTTVLGPSGFGSFLLYLIEKIKIDTMSKGKQNKQDKSVLACKEVMVSFSEIQVNKTPPPGATDIKNEEDKKQQSNEMVTRQKVIDFLVEDIFSNPRLKLRSRSGEVSLTLEDYIQVTPANAGGNQSQHPIGLFELFLTYYLKLLLPCSDYFESLMVEHYQKCEKYRIENENQRRLNSQQRPLQSGINNGQTPIQQTGVRQQFQSDRFLNKNLSRSGAVMGGGFIPSEAGGVPQNNKAPIQNRHTLHVQHSLVHSRSQLKFKGKAGYPTQFGFGKNHSHFDHNGTVVNGHSAMNQQVLPNKQFAVRQKTLGILNNIQHSQENHGSGHLPIQGNQFGQNNMRSIDMKNVPHNMRVAIGGGAHPPGSHSVLNSYTPVNNLGVPAGRSLAAMALARVHSEQSRPESGFNSQNEESKHQNDGNNSPSWKAATPIHANDSNSQQKFSQNNNNRQIGPSKFRESFNRNLQDNRAKSADPNAAIAPSGLVSGLGSKKVPLGVNEVEQNRNNSNSRNQRLPQDSGLEEAEENPPSDSNVGNAGNEEESLLGLTQARDADELHPQEHINHPIVYNLHSNYQVLRKNNESQLIDSCMGKMIQGCQGPWQVNRPGYVNGMPASNSQQTMFQTREIIYDVMATNNNLGQSYVSSMAGGSFLMMKIMQHRKSQLIQSRNADYYDNQSNMGLPMAHNNPSGERTLNDATMPLLNQTLQQQQNEIRSIVEEEGESLLDLEDDQEGLIRNHRKAILQNEPIAEYTARMYRKIVTRRHEERKSTLESQISSSENVAWEVVFKVPEEENASKDAAKDKSKSPQQRQAKESMKDTSLNQVNNSSTMKNLKRFFIKIEGHDVYCVHEPSQRLDTPKLKFLHCLLGCSFQIKPPEDPGYLKYIQSLPRTQGAFAIQSRINLNSGGQQQNIHPVNDSGAEEPPGNNPSHSLGQGGNNLIMQSNNNIVGGGAYQQIPVSMCHQVQIKLSEKHKRVFYVKSKEMAAEIVKRMRVAAGAREVEEYYGPQNSSINAAGMTGKEGSSGVNNPQANILGQGTYGKVYKAFQKTTQKPVAIKQINKKALILEELELQQHEIHLYRTLTDDNYRGTVRLLDVFEDHLQLNVVLEFIEGRNLFHWIKQEKEVDEDKSRRLFREIVRVVGYVHSKGIVHRDIKLENIMLRQLPPNLSNDKQVRESMKQGGRVLLQPKPTGEDMPIEDYGGADPEFQVRLIDFGLSKVLIPGETSTDPYGTLAYCSPEIIGKRPHTQQTDVWSLGIVLYTLLTRRMPFVVSHDVEQTKNNILYRALNFDNPLWQAVSEEAKDLLSRMLEKDGKQRISCEGALRHPWLVKGTSLAKEAKFQFTGEKRDRSETVANNHQRNGSSYVKNR